MTGKLVLAMSKYTTLLRFPIEQHLKDIGKSNDESNWKDCYRMLGLYDYPIFDETYRETLNNKIIRAYYFREIGFETLGIFAWYLRRTMHEIMPYYNQLYESERIKIEPLLTIGKDYSEIWSRDERTGKTVTNSSHSNATTSGSSSSESTDRNVFQDTPMNGLDTDAISSMDYATNVTFDNGTTSASNENTSNSTAGYNTSDSFTGDYDGTRKHSETGFTVSQSELLLTYRKTFLNIDLDIIKELESLFMGLW